MNLAQLLIVILFTLILSGCMPPLEGSCFDGITVDLKFENNSERDASVFSYGRDIHGTVDDGMRGRQIEITTDQSDDQMEEIGKLESIELFPNSEREKEVAALGREESGWVSSVLLEVVFDDGRSSWIAGWPKRYQTLPDVIEYDVGYVESDENVLISKFHKDGKPECWVPLLITVNVDESISLSRWD